MDSYLSPKGRGEIGTVKKWLRNAGLIFCVFCCFGGMYTMYLDWQAKDHSHIAGYVFWVIVGAVPLILFVRNFFLRLSARSIADQIQFYSGEEVPLRWVCSHANVATEDVVRFFSKGYFINLDLDLNRRVIRKKTLPRAVPGRNR